MSVDFPIQEIIPEIIKQEPTPMDEDIPPNKKLMVDHPEASTKKTTNFSLTNYQIIKLTLFCLSNQEEIHTLTFFDTTLISFLIQG